MRRSRASIKAGKFDSFQSLASVGMRCRLLAVECHDVGDLSGRRELLNCKRVVLGFLKPLPGQGCAWIFRRHRAAVPRVLWWPARRQRRRAAIRSGRQS